jgi:iron-sulfur cluster assembly accessory protein
MLLRLTEQAAARILESARESCNQGQPLRVAARRTSNGSVEYAMGFDDMQEIDSSSHQHGVEILISPTSADLLSGVVLDYAEIDSEREMQFIFLNPNDPDFTPPAAD